MTHHQRQLICCLLHLWAFLLVFGCVSKVFLRTYSVFYLFLCVLLDVSFGFFSVSFGFYAGFGVSFGVFLRVFWRVFWRVLRSGWALTGIVFKNYASGFGKFTLGIFENFGKITPGIF